MKFYDDSVILDIGSINLKFEKASLTFIKTDIQNIFSQKNNKTVGETCKHKRYLNIGNYFIEKYKNHKETPLGTFLLSLKENRCNDYKLFLNKYGDEFFCHFKLGSENLSALRGLYIFLLKDELKYIGRCRDKFIKRFDNGYGRISPKNCFIDGQTTNCHLNSLINASHDSVSLYLCPLDLEEQIVKYEYLFIKHYNPKWNIQLKLS